jgi:hypothetical protein
MSEAIREKEAELEREARRRASLTQEERDAEDAKREAYQRKIKEMAEKSSAKMEANKKAVQALLTPVKYLFGGLFVFALLISLVGNLISLLFNGKALL